MTPIFWLALIAFVATFIQTAAGFGMALVAMPLFVLLVGVKTAVPLMSLLGSTIGLLLMRHYRHALDLRAVVRLVLAALVGVPLGVYLLQIMPAELFARLLGGFLLLYAGYSLLALRLPALAHRRWAYLFGFASGLLNGAYAIAGPPVIVYATCRRWPPATFKSNLQTFFFTTGLVALATHALSGNYTAVVLTHFATAVPGALLGLALGFRLDGYLQGERFRRLVLLLLLALSLQLLLT